MYTPETYRTRLIDKKINLYLQATGAISLTGMRFVGKTTTGQAHCKSEISLADSRNNFSNRTLAQASPDYVLKGEYPRLIDEWQEVLPIWDAVRFACDSTPENGHFILTGSSIANFESSEIFHSGTGRIATLQMSSMTLLETGDSSGDVSLEDMFNKPTPMIPLGKVNLDDLVRYCVRGGWPKTIDSPIEIAHITPTEYIKTLAEKDFNSLPSMKNKRSPQKIMAVLTTMAKAESSISGASEISKSLKESYEIAISRQTMDAYIDAFRHLFIIEDQKAYTLPGGTTGGKLLKSPKLRFADPSLVVAALGLRPGMLVEDMETFGKVFDCLCVHELRIYAESIDAQIYHLLEGHGSISADAVVELKDGRIGLFKHRVGAHQIDEAAAGLLKAKKFLENSGKSPSMLCVVCGMADAVYTRPDGVIVTPLTALKP
ncbi:MAG: AAA family ATPase [Oscillospiraceae bacterium]|nr:AAA family ATPase [Oscillospiraceae bacterium]